MYPGSKGAMAKRIIAYIPQDTMLYCEPYAGSCAVLFAKDPHPTEVINDIDGDIVNLFRVLKSKDLANELRHMVQYTPYARAEFERAKQLMSNKDKITEVERAWATMVTSLMSVNGMGAQFSRGFDTRNGVNIRVNSWLMRQALIDAYVFRLKHCIIDQMDGIECIKYYDHANAFFYIDPPYIRSKKSELYNHEMNIQLHEQLVETLLSLKGSAVVSGYKHDIYNKLDESNGFQRIDIPRKTTLKCSQLEGRDQRILSPGSKPPRVESLWVKTRN